jgi:glutamate-1-semialdehyde 2,1-aminomutase
MSTKRSEELFKRAVQLIPGGVNSPVRAFRGVARDGEEACPRFFDRGEGAYVYDSDGNKLIDLICSWGAHILGHRSPVVERAIAGALERSTSFGAPTEAEVEFAEVLCSTVPSLEMVRLVNSGTEATMAAIRLARGITGREVIIKFDGCYHGHGDSLLVAAGSGVATLGIAGSPGIPEAIARASASIEFNDLELFERSVEKIGPEKIAAVIIEPVPGNMGLVLPKPGYLEGIRRVCDRHGIVLIFDEVMCGFRVALGGAQERFGVMPDLTTLGKVIGGGLPIGAFGGKRELMNKLAPAGPVYQAGTMSGNPLAVAAGMAVVNELKRTNPYPVFEKRTARIAKGLIEAATAAGVPLVATSCGSMFGFFFSSEPVNDFSAAKRSDISKFKDFFHKMLAEGVYLAPSAFEAGFIGVEHGDEVVGEIVEAAGECVR